MTNNRREYRINEAIRAPEVRLVDSNGAQLGVMSREQALALARERDVDLVEVAPGATPPVCRLIDFGKLKYEEAKRARDAQRKQKSSDVRPIRLRPLIDDHDLGIKMKTARKFLEAGNKVRMNVLFRRRELARPEIGRKVLAKVAEGLVDVATVERLPRLEGRFMTMQLSPK